MNSSRLKFFYLAAKHELSCILESLIAAYPETNIGSALRHWYFHKIRRVPIGFNSFLGSRVAIHNRCPVVIGDNFIAGSNVTISGNDSFGIKIGNNVGIADGTFIRSGNHSFAKIDQPYQEQGHVAKRLVLADGSTASPDPHRTLRLTYFTCDLLCLSLL